MEAEHLRTTEAPAPPTQGAHPNHPSSWQEHKRKLDAEYLARHERLSKEHTALENKCLHDARERERQLQVTHADEMHRLQAALEEERAANENLKKKCADAETNLSKLG